MTSNFILLLFETLGQTVLLQIKCEKFDFRFMSKNTIVINTNFKMKMLVNRFIFVILYLYIFECSIWQPALSIILFSNEPELGAKVDPGLAQNPIAIHYFR
jgi:hypothetical protein